MIDSIVSPFHSLKCVRQNFSQQYEDNIKQTSTENKENDQFMDYKLIQTKFSELTS